MSALADSPSCYDDRKVVTKYVGRYAEPSVRSGAALDDAYTHAVVIPAYGEGPILDRVLGSVPCVPGAPVLAVVVVNEREDSPPEVRVANSASVERLRQRYSPHRHVPPDVDVCQAPFGAVAILRVTLPRRQGVGLARKHGVDFAFGAWVAGKLSSRWIHCTDADVQLPHDYFSAPRAPGAAALHPFRHVAVEPDTQGFTVIYDLWLRLHVLGLRWAGSPYAFHSIGSTMAVDALSYAAVRGVPRRIAAEDFYFLNKLSKLGAIVAAPSGPIEIDARVSDRVPFGTGRSIARMQREGVCALPRFYHPKVYQYLATLLHYFDRGVDRSAFEVEGIVPSLREQQLAVEPMNAALQALGVAPAVERLLRASSDREPRRRAIQGWFDGFRTMKFIHHLRDHGIAEDDPIAALNASRFLLEQSSELVHDDIGEVRRVLDDANLYTCISRMSPSAT